MRDATIDRLARACVACIVAGFMFAAIGDQRAALAACVAGTIAGVAACIGDPTIRPWH